MIGLAFALGMVCGGFDRMARSFGADDTEGGAGPWPLGRWRVVERGWGLASPLLRLEVRRANVAGDAIAIAFEEDGQGKERVWGSARLDRQVVAAASARWLTAEWSSGQNSVLLQVRPEPDGRLAALIRQRDRHRPPVTAERVRQAMLEREPADARRDPEPVVRDNSRIRRRPEADGPVAHRGDLVGLFVVGKDGSSLRCIAEPEGFSRAAHPAWSPDGRWIAFTAFDATGRDPLIRIVAADGGRTTAVAAGISPSWSRDGDRLAYVASGRPEFATDWNVPGRNDEQIEAIRLTGPGAGEIEVIGRGLWPRWAPTDDRLAFASRRESNWDLFLRSDDGLRLTRLTDDPALDTHPVWAADGRSLIFLSDRANRWDLYRVAADGHGKLDRLTDHRRREEGAELGPDGEVVAFTDSPNRGESQVWLLELASGLAHPLLDSPNGDRDPAWSPDGRSIAFVSRRPSPSTSRTRTP